MLFLIPAFLLITLIRFRWVSHHIDDYTAKALWYLWRTKQSTELGHDMAQLWPVGHMILELWRWDFRRYVVDHEQYDQMEVFIANELKRNDLTIELFNEPTDKP